jgi:zinc/manganese transport system substrate-binding protein
VRVVAGVLVTALAAAGCTLGERPAGGATGAKPVAVASLSAWGSILAQLGGARVHTVSIISNPNTDPHDYEPTPADARAIAAAGLVVENGVGYDGWTDRLVEASPAPARKVINVGDLVGVPADGNPHRWYAPADVDRVATAITTALQSLDPADASYYAARHRAFVSALGAYHRLITTIRTTYAGERVGASESIFTPLAAALGLHVVTPAGFLKAVSEGVEPSAADQSTIDAQIRDHDIGVYVFNSQNGTPVVTAQVLAARAAGIPVTSITETLTPAGATFQQWQVSQLRDLQRALRQATGR